jgi:hypothetical protein
MHLHALLPFIWSQNILLVRVGARSFHTLLAGLILLSSCTSALPGELSFFLDAYCDKASTVLPIAKLELGTCLVPVGVYGLKVNTVPPCPNDGSASLVM